MHNAQVADCLVVGAGPAGLTAALYLRRYLRHVVVVDHGHSRALSIERSHNYPAFPEGISGRDMLMRLRQQLASVQLEVTAAEVTALQRHSKGTIAAQCGTLTFVSTTVLLATGVMDTVPSLPGVELLQKGGLLRQCPICDGYEHRGKRIVVLGDGPHAEREAAFIAHYSPQVTQAGLSGPAKAQPGVRALPALAVRADAPPSGGVRLCLADGSTHDFDVAYVAMGAHPRAQLGRSLGAEVDLQGSLVVDVHGSTSVKGLYAAGDVVSGLDQLAVATGQGAIAATAIHNFLRMGAE